MTYDTYGEDYHMDLRPHLPSRLCDCEECAPSFTTCQQDCDCPIIERDRPAIEAILGRLNLENLI